MKNLRRALIRLAHAKPELRTDLLPLIRQASLDTTVGTVITVQSGSGFSKLTLNYLRTDKRKWQKVYVESQGSTVFATRVFPDILSDAELKEAEQNGRAFPALPGIENHRILQPIHLDALSVGAKIHHPKYGTAVLKSNGWYGIEKGSLDIPGAKYPAGPFLASHFDAAIRNPPGYSVVS